MTNASSDSRIVLYAPAGRDRTSEVMMGHRGFVPSDYAEVYSARRDMVALDCWGVQQVAEYLLHLSIAGKLAVPVGTGMVLEDRGRRYMFVGDAMHGASTTLDYMPLPAWDQYGLVALKDAAPC